MAVSRVLDPLHDLQWLFHVRSTRCMACNGYFTYVSTSFDGQCSKSVSTAVIPYENGLAGSGMSDVNEVVLFLSLIWVSGCAVREISMSLPKICCRVEFMAYDESMLAQKFRHSEKSGF